MLRTVLMAAIVLLSSFIFTFPEEGLSLPGTSHDTISIDGDEDLVQTAFLEGWNGTGAVDDPFVIEGLEIEGGQDISCIELFNISYSVFIRNCSVTNSTETGLVWDNGGLHLRNTSDIRIENLTASYCDIGILVENSREIIIDESLFNKNYMGIYSSSSENITLHESVSIDSDYGITSNHCNGFSVMECSISLASRGMDFEGTSNTTVDSTNFTRCQTGIFYEGDRYTSDLTVMRNNFTQIFQNGIEINVVYQGVIRNNRFRNITQYSIKSYWINYNLSIHDNLVFNSGISVYNGNEDSKWDIRTWIHNNTITGSYIHGIYMESNVEVRDNDINGTIIGIYAGSQGFGYNNIMKGNTVSNCTQVGIKAGNFDLIEENNVKDCGEGMILEGDNNTVKYNLVQNCSGNGLSINGNYGRFEENVICGNLKNGIDLDMSWNLYLIKNHIYENGEHGIKSSYCANIVYEGSQIHDNGGMGMNTLDSRKMTLRNVSSSFNEMVNLNLRCYEEIIADGLEVYSSETGAFFMSTMDVRVTNSSFFDLETGIEFYQFGSLNMSYNSFDGCGIYFSDSDQLEELNVDYVSLGDTNKINGRTIYLLDEGYTNSKVPYDAGQLFIKGLDGIEAENLDLSDATVGITAVGSTELSVTNCSLDGNSMGILAVDCIDLYCGGSSFINAGTGIEIYNTTGIILEKNTFARGRGRGAYVSNNSFYCTVRNNLFFGSEGVTSYAIESLANDTVVHGNHFVYNRGTGDEYVAYLTQAVDPLGIVNWSGNYWRDHHYPDMNGDGIVDSPYYLEPHYQTNDTFPLANSFLFDPPPMELKVKVDPPRAILTWEKPDINNLAEVTGFFIYRREWPGNLELLDKVSSDVTAYIDLNVTAGREYRYSISMSNNFFEGDRSNEIMATFQEELPLLEILDPMEGNVTGSDNMLVKWDVDNTSRVERYEVRIDLEEWIDVGTASQYRFINLTEGNHFVRVKAVAKTGGEVVEQVGFLVDRGAPTIRILNPSEGDILANNFTTAIWTATDDLSEVDDFLVSIDFGEVYSISGSNQINLLNLTEGYHTLNVTGFDEGGNRNTDEIVFRVDTIEPSIRMIGPEEGLVTASRNVEVRWEAYDIGSGIDLFQVRLDDQEWYDLSPETFSRSFFQLDDGWHNVRILARDLAGNTNTTNVSFTVDATPPDLIIDSPRKGSHVSQAPVSVTWTVLDAVTGVDRIEYKDNTSEWKEVQTDRISLTGLEEKTYTISIRAFDGVGNVAEESTTFTVDRTSPEILGYGPTGTDEPLNEPVYVSFSERMNTATPRFLIQGVNGNLVWKGDRAVFEPERRLEPGRTYNVSVSGTDLAGNALEPLEWTFTTTIFGKVRGMVVNDKGNSIDEAEIRIGDIVAESRPDGGFFLELENGNYSLKINKDGYETKTLAINITAGEINDLGDIVMEKEKKEGINLLAVILVPVALILMVVLVVIFGNIWKQSRRTDFEE
mgnify:CR=1 FL=1